MLNEKTTKELMEIATELGIKGRWKMNKTQLIEAIDRNSVEFPDSTEREENTNTNDTTEVVTETKSEDQMIKKERKTKLFTYNDKTQSLRAWSEETGIGMTTLYDRLIYKNWDVEKAFTTPTRKVKLENDKTQTTKVN